MVYHTIEMKRLLYFLLLVILIILAVLLHAQPQIQETNMPELRGIDVLNLPYA